jgi:hypothetical protein
VLSIRAWQGAGAHGSRTRLRHAQQQRRRVALVNGSARPELASSVAGIMFANHIISGQQHAAAEKFARARAAIFGMPLSTGATGPEASEARTVRLERLYAAMLAGSALISRWPWSTSRWNCGRAGLGVRCSASRSPGEHQHLLDGLDALA